VYDLRIDTALLGDMDTALISEIAAAYRSSNLRTLTKLIDKRKHYA